MTESTTTQKAVEAVRPLSATQARALAKLVENDAEQVRAEIDEFADAQIADAVERITAEWEATEGSSDAWEDKARRIMSRYESSRLRLIREAKDAGVTLTIPRVGRDRYEDRLSVTVEGLKEAIEQEKERINTARRAAKNRLHRQKLALDRRVLEASITSQAQAVLDSLPSARDLMLADAAGLAGRASTAKALDS